ncbi:acyl-CoA thioester hydrolase [Litoreibacter meonggei]|uniref:Acyl-CoA thioester hydrolase n=1 Tax=Litoreibacter meonggei TaxID=1049199 RepID=A0A497WT15_9RHOB|nr:thioesterase family protein [Litoreibacter meonggei]RLJ59847.1 acyl-CoA thioester hydrolase [Litoreibacter meonggei]
MKTLPYHTPLDADTLRAFGIPEPWRFGVADRTRFGELDPLGHINNAAYLGWFESFRIQYMQAYGIGYIGEDAPQLVLRQVQVDYLAEMKLAEDYIVTGRSSVLRKSSFKMDYAVWSGGKLRTTSHAVIVQLNADGTKRPMSPELRDLLKSRDGAVDA